jgi:hypothetical protein
MLCKPRPTFASYYVPGRVKFAGLNTQPGNDSGVPVLVFVYFIVPGTHTIPTLTTKFIFFFVSLFLPDFTEPEEGINRIYRHGGHALPEGTFDKK